METKRVQGSEMVPSTLMFVLVRHNDNKIENKCYLGIQKWAKFSWFLPPLQLQ